jgi:hypothetical protein
MGYLKICSENTENSEFSKTSRSNKITKLEKRGMGEDLKEE